MAVTTADLEALDLAIAKSELKVRIDGREVEYRSTDELIKARNYLSGLLAGASGSTRRVAFQYRFTTNRGE